MAIEIDARGLDCPQPVIEAKKALEKNNDITIIVDNSTAQENIRRLAMNIGSIIKEDEKNDGIYIHIKKNESKTDTFKQKEENAENVSVGPNVVVISDDAMGNGNRELGHLLIQGFIHTLLEVSNKPDVMLFFNNGVKLTVEGSEVLEDLNELEKQGTKILVCGTCLNFYEVKEKLKAGVVSNMYDIAENMVTSGRLIKI